MNRSVVASVRSSKKGLQELTDAALSKAIKSTAQTIRSAQKLQADLRAGKAFPLNRLAREQMESSMLKIEEKLQKELGALKREQGRRAVL
jgi:hypothetical protein